jgi:hypothetical protein
VCSRSVYIDAVMTVAVEPGVQSFHVGKRSAGDFHVRSTAGQHRVWHCCGQVGSVFSLLIPQEVRSQRFARNKKTFIKIVAYMKMFKLRMRIIFWT